MKMKYILPISLVILVGLAVFVSAWTSEYGAPIYKGWNLVYGFMSPDQFEGQGFDGTHIKAVYALDPETQGYVRFYPNPDTSKFPSQMNENDQIQNMAFWVYSDSETKETFNGIYNAVEYWLYESFIPYNERQLYKGWNFLGITHDMVVDVNSATPEEEAKYTLDAMKGNCNIEKAYGFDSSSQNWVSFPLTEELDKSVTGSGLAIKVSNNCKLGTSEGTITPPPSLP